MHVDATLNGTHSGTFSLLESGTVRAIHIANFLPPKERDALFEAVCKEQEAFKTAGLPGTPPGPTKHFSSGSGPDTGNDSKSIQTAYQFFSNRVIEQLPGFCETLGVKPLTVSDIPLSLMNGVDGHLGVPHTDSTNGQYQVSILYYFHRVPKVFSGGDLEFYAADEKTRNGHSQKPLFSIDIEDNLLVVFPSDTFHGVTKVLSDSNDFTDGRFVAVGFLGA